MPEFSLFRIFAFLFSFLLIIILTQDLQVFPAVLISVFEKSGARDPKTLPANVESVFVETKDKKKIELWRMPPAPDVPARPYVALIFHGNGGSLKNFLPLQLWFHSQGITSYGFDYRGYGKSSGWPSERGIGLDSDAVYDYVKTRENLTSENLIIMGMSVGGAPAARLASFHRPKLLILLSAFTSARDLLWEMPVMGYLTPFFWYSLPTAEHVERLRKTNLIVAHGVLDTIVPPEHAEGIIQAYKGTGRVESILHPTSDHNTLFFTIREQLAQKMVELLK